MKKNIIVIVPLLLLIVISLVITNSVTTNKKDNNIKVVTSFYPMYVATLNITDGVKGVTLSNLTSQTTGCLHDYALITEEIMNLADANLLVINGASMEGFLDKVLKNYPSLIVVDSSEGIELIHDEDESEQETEEHTHEYNSHIFGSISNYIVQVQNITKGLVKLDPSNSKKYEQNSKVYISKLKVLEEKLNKVKEEIQYTNIVTYHNSFDYLAKELGLNIIETVESEHGSYISAGDIARIIDSIKLNNVKALFIEKDSNKTISNALAKEAGIDIYELNVGTFGEFNKDAYITNMEKNISIIKEALK